MTEQKPPTAQEIKARHSELRWKAQRFAAALLRADMRLNDELQEMVACEEIATDEVQVMEDEIYRIIHYLERGRR